MELILILAFTILFAWISGKMAERRGRNVVVWVLVSVLITPLIAWILLGFMGDTDEMVAKKATTNAQVL